MSRNTFTNVNSQDYTQCQVKYTFAKALLEVFLWIESSCSSSFLNCLAIVTYQVKRGVCISLIPIYWRLPTFPRFFHYSPSDWEMNGRFYNTYTLIKVSPRAPSIKDGVKAADTHMVCLSLRSARCEPPSCSGTHYTCIYLYNASL